MSRRQITVQQVKAVAKLAKLPLSKEEIKLYTKQFDQIIGYINQLEKIKINNVKPTFQTLDGTVNVWREDEIKPGLTQKQALSAAKITHRGYFVADNVFTKNIPKFKSKTSFPSRNKLDDFGAVITEVDSKKGTVGHKDLFCTQGVETTAGSNLLVGYVPQYSATIVKRLEKLGFKTKYKLNQDAWGHGSSGENSDFFPTQNPWDRKRVAGGSSSGSAAMVSLGELELATGTDTGGSIRMPASFCNLTGIKPTYGSLSRYGVIAFASSLDCPSLIARSAKKLETVYRKIAIPDKLDSTSQSPSRNKINRKTIKTIGIPGKFFSKGIDSSVKRLISQAIKLLAKSGYQVKEIDLPHAHLAMAVYYLIAPTEASSNLARYDGIRFGNNRSFFGPEAKRRIMIGAFASSAGYSSRYYERAAKIRTLIINDFEKAFKSVDAILSPVSPIPPFFIGEKAADPLKLYLMDVYSTPASLSGLPAIALPCGFVDKLPVGMQLIGPRWSETGLFTLAKKYQQLTNWHKQTPPMSSHNLHCHSRAGGNPYKLNRFRVKHGMTNGL